jgi:hypothetical protein
MNKTSILFLFAFLALASASFLEKADSPKSLAFDTSGLSSTELYIAAIGFIAVGALNLLFGLKYFKAIIFLIGFVGAATATYTVEYSTSPGAGHLTLILYSLIGGLIGGVIFYFCYHCSIFTLGFMLFGVIAFALLSYFGVGSSIALIVFLIAGVVGGIVALKVHDIIIILATSFSGAGYITTAICIFMHGTYFTAYYTQTMYVLMIIALAIGGIIFQFKNKDVDVNDIGRNSVSAPDVYALDVNGGNPYNPYTGRKF